MADLTSQELEDYNRMMHALANVPIVNIIFRGTTPDINATALTLAERDRVAEALLPVIAKIRSELEVGHAN